MDKEPILDSPKVNQSSKTINNISELDIALQNDIDNFDQFYRQYDDSLNVSSTHFTQNNRLRDEHF